MNNKARFFDLISFTLPFLIISIIDKAVLNRGQFDYFSAETVAIFFSSGLTLFYQDIFSIHNVVNHHPQNFNTLLSIIFFALNEISFETFKQYLDLIFFSNLIFLLLTSYVVVELNKEIRLESYKIFILSLLSVSFPATVFLSMYAPSGYLSYGISSLPAVFSIYVILNFKNFSSFSIKLSLINMGFLLNISFINIIIIFVLIITLITNLEYLKNWKNKNFTLNKFEELSFFIFLLSFFYFFFRSFLFLFSMYKLKEGNYFYYYLGELNVLIFSFLFSLLLFFIQKKYEKLFINFKYFFFPIIFGWFLGANILSFGWFRSFFLNIFSRVDLTKGLVNKESIIDFKFFINFFEMSLNNYFISLIFLFSIFFIFYDFKQRRLYLFISLVIFINLILVQDQFAKNAINDGYFFNRFFQTSNIAIILFCFLKVNKFSSKGLTLFILLIPVINYSEYFKKAHRLAETKNIKIKVDQILEKAINNNQRIVCYRTFLPDICNYSMSINLTKGKSFYEFKPFTENFINVDYLKDFDLKKNDILVSGERNDLKGEIILLWEKDKKDLGLKPFIEVKKLNIN